MSENKEVKKVLRIKDVAALWDITPHTLRARIQRGTFPVEPFNGGNGHKGKRYEWRRADVERWLSGETQTAKRKG
jgi:predicted DNA-binding transcriptional regulator AlpA